MNSVVVFLYNCLSFCDNSAIDNHYQQDYNDFANDN